MKLDISYTSCWGYLVEWGYSELHSHCTSGLNKVVWVMVLLRIFCYELYYMLVDIMTWWYNCLDYVPNYTEMHDWVYKTLYNFSCYVHGLCITNMTCIGSLFCIGIFKVSWHGFMRFPIFACFLCCMCIWFYT